MQAGQEGWVLEWGVPQAAQRKVGLGIQEEAQRLVVGEHAGG